ncbi:MAG: DUF2235 domain-containing protein [Akkermansiaceae bacterium]|nr:DUF2235 domain-containing protein [Akkermansiaceae bacterium]
MGRNIIICTDGTANQFKPGRNSNVVKLYSVLERSGEQIIYYDPGVGTVGSYSALTWVARKAQWILGMAFGLGTTRDIIEAYSFLMENYREGDRIFLFGFSRGAFTARAIAGLLYKCGLLHPNNQNLIPEAMRIYKGHRNWDVADGFRATYSRPPVPIHFLGLFETVTSVGWVWDPVRLDFTTTNPAILHVRHAMAIDERRAFFRANRWRRHGEAGGQDIRQVWFAGVHSDIGGGYPREESGLSNIGLEWMLVEAGRAGLRLDGGAAIRIVNDPAPDPGRDAHRSLRGAWWPAEVWPKLKNRRNRHGKWVRYPALNLAKRRGIYCDEPIHETVVDRIAGRDDYPPPNLAGRKCRCKDDGTGAQACKHPESPVEARVPLGDFLQGGGPSGPGQPEVLPEGKERMLDSGS